MKNFTKYLAVFALTFLGLAVCSVIHAPKAAAVTGSQFNAARIIDDDVFFNANTMNPGDIQNFLNAKVGACRAGYTCLKNYQQGIPSVGGDAYCNGIGGGTKSAADIIFNVAQACGINPQSLIVLLEKEQSLITDDWPTDNQYKIAMGYGCPDTAACDSQYYGFFNQVYNAGRQMKRYTRQPQLFNYAAGRTSFIQYNPNAGCSGTNVGIQTPATAALYNYTPYQPNPAALANLYGLGDGCSAYGNRNFWRIFNDWFGGTQGDGYTLAVDDTDHTQWVVFGGVRQYVGSAEIKRAWGLPDDAVTMTHAYLSSITQGPWLGRLFHLNGSPDLYFADGGKKYYVGSSQMRDAWGFTGQTDTYVSHGLFNTPQPAGNLTYSVKKASSPSLYMIDGLNGSNQMVLRQYSTPDIFHAWEGDADNYTTLSDDYFNQIDNAVGTALAGYTIKEPNGPTQYQVVAGQKLYLNGAISSIYNQTYNTVGQATINRLVTSAPASNLVRLPGNVATIYMVDAGQKHPVSSVEVLRAWSPAATPQVNIVDQGFLNLISTGAVLDTYEADVAGQLYLMDGRKVPVPAGLDSAYRTGNVFGSSAALMNSFSSSANATNFVKGSGPSIYLMDNTSIRHIASAEDWQLWNGNRGEGLTTVSEAVLSKFNNAGQINHYFSAGSTNYVIDNGTFHSVAADVATDWSLSNPVSINTATRDRFTAGAALTQKAKVGPNYYRIKYGKTNITADTTVAALWGVSSSPVTLTNNLIATLPSSSALSIFAKSTDTNDNRIFLVDSGPIFYHISSVEQFQTYGYNGGDLIAAVQPSDLGSPGTAKNIIKTATADTERVIDGGQKHPFTNSTIRDRWVTGSNTLMISDTLWSYFSGGVTFSGNVKASAPNVYNIDTGQKRWVQSQGAYQTYTSQYGSYSTISNQLLNLLPTGNIIP
jgi:hypothetical protein